jgi:hypothetical protein
LARPLRPTVALIATLPRDGLPPLGGQSHLTTALAWLTLLLTGYEAGSSSSPSLPPLSGPSPDGSMSVAVPRADLPPLPDPLSSQDVDFRFFCAPPARPACPPQVRTRGGEVS